jgi:hypothetical protein
MGLELADIFRQYGEAYRKKYAAGLLPSHRQAMKAIEVCRTEALGGQVYSCNSCNLTRYSYHSCRNRHCPKCQNERTQEWLEVQQALLLPVPYFLLTFTLPSELRKFASQKQKLFYNLLFRISAKVTQQLARDPRFVGGQIGMVGVMHTWTRNLTYHPHVHYLVPGGGLSEGGKDWLPSQRNFFLPVKALSKLFRATFQHALKKTAFYLNIPHKVWQQDWVVHCKAVGNGQAVLKYLAPYIHRVAISNHRLLSLSPSDSMKNAQITFKYRTSGTKKNKTCRISAERFMQRFLQHVLPRGFVKVRYYGFFGARVRSRLTALQQELGRDSNPKQSEDKNPDTNDEETHQNLLCPLCGQVLIFQRSIHPLACRSP